MANSWNTKTSCNYKTIHEDLLLYEIWWNLFPPQMNLHWHLVVAVGSRTNFDEINYWKFDPKNYSVKILSCTQYPNKQTKFKFAPPITSSIKLHLPLILFFLLYRGKKNWVQNSLRWDLQQLFFSLLSPSSQPFFFPHYVRMWLLAFRWQRPSPKLTGHSSASPSTGGRPISATMECVLGISHLCWTW